MINYFKLGGSKRLNEIVIAGSHDAGISVGKKNAKTQDLDIYGQARVGVRFFDLRVVARDVVLDEDNNVTGAQLTTYHADKSMQKDPVKKVVHVANLNKQKDVLANKSTHYSNHTKHIETTELKNMALGPTYGLGLVKILRDARKFVHENKTEFLILKFDKCTNWALIGKYCRAKLSSSLYKGTGNINTTPIGKLQGKVIVLFAQEGYNQIPDRYKGPDGGILCIQNLYNKKVKITYEEDFNGIQYFGKGGTSVMKPFRKMSQNISTQKSLLNKGSSRHSDVMGMMYWTTTGMFESIKKRDADMWKQGNISKLQKLWAQGLKHSIEARTNESLDKIDYGSNGMIKAFMPNIVMIDFANEDRCEFIYRLNRTASYSLTWAAMQWEGQKSELEYNPVQKSPWENEPAYAEEFS